VRANGGNGNSITIKFFTALYNRDDIGHISSIKNAYGNDSLAIASKPANISSSLAQIVARSDNSSIYNLLALLKFSSARQFHSVICNAE